MEKDAIKIDELEYFNPFVSIKEQCDLFTSDIFSCDLTMQQQIFLYLSCCDCFDKNCKIYNKSSYWPSRIKSHPEIGFSWETLQKQYELDEFLDNKNITHINIKKSTCYTEERAINLNKNLKQLKTKISKFIKNYANSTNIYNNCDYLPDENMPYIFHLQEIIRIFRTYNYSLNKQHKMFIIWKKLFEFETITDLFNFQGCLGLLLMNEFCFYYCKNNLKYCILCTALITSLCIYSPIYRRMETIYLKKVIKFHGKLQEVKEEYISAGIASGLKRGQYREQGYEIWKNNKLYEQKPGVIINIFRDLYEKKFGKDGLPVDNTLRAWFRYYRKKDTESKKINCIERLQ